MADNLFDQVKFGLGLFTFAYAVWSIWGGRVGIGKPPWPGDYIPQLGGAPAEDAPADAESMLAGGYYYGRPIRDAGLPWEGTEFGENDPRNRLTVA